MAQVVGNLEGAVVDAFRDAQTSITSLGGAVAGAAGEQLGNYIIHRTGLGKSDGLGQTGLRFVVRSIVASASFGFVARYMPATSENVFFSIVFFAASPSMVSDAVTLGKHAVLAIEDLFGGWIPKPPPRYGPGPVISQKCDAQGKNCKGYGN